MINEYDDNLKDTEAALDVLRDAIESLSEGFALYDDDRRLVMFNQRYAQMNKGVAHLLKPGLDWEILMRETARKGIYSDAIGKEDDWITDRLINGVEFIQDFELKETDGKTYLVSVHPTKLGGFVVTREDVTDRKQVEASERDGDLLIRTVLDASSAIVTMARIGDGQILYRTPAALRIFGPTKSAKEHYVDENIRADIITELLVDGRVDNLKVDLFDATKRVFPASISSQIVEYKGEEVVVTSIVDLTVQSEANALIRQVMEAYPAAINMTNAETGEILFATPEIEALFGPAESSKGYYADPGERERYLRELRAKGELKERKVEFLNAKGEKFWAADSSRLINYNDQEVIISNTRDLTEELALQEELSNQREMLFQNEKMSALGELLAGVAHELNNPLSVIVGRSLMLMEETTDPELATQIEKIGNAAERCSKIVKTFLAMARQKPKRIEKVDVGSVVETALDVVSYGDKAKEIQIESKGLENLPAIAADADQIAQVIINLVINAEQAINSSGVGDEIVVSASYQQNRDMVELFVEDNGPGIPKAIQQRIFEPFFTTKDIGEGTGIGLAFCHRIILSHGGQIRLDAGKQNGSRFKITLPIAKAPDLPEDENEASYQKISSRTALVVDDEVEVGEITAEILRKDGFEVELVSAGKDALERLSQTDFDIFLCDMNMPEVDGRAIYETISSELPHMLSKTAFVTGDTMGSASQKLLGESGLPYLEKPVAPSEFRELVAKLISEQKE